MKKTVIFYGLVLAVLVVTLKYLEYRFFVRSLSAEIYIGLLVTLFTGLGVWMGLKLTRKPGKPEAPQLPAEVTAKNFQPEPEILELNNATDLGISSRELEVLELMAQGLTNQEIADQLFVSLNTVKTHAANLYAKLEVNRRTQAIQKAKQLKIIP